MQELAIAPESKQKLRRGTSGFAVLRYRVSFLRGIAVLRAKIGGIAVLSFYSAVCGIVKNQHAQFMKYYFSDKEPIVFKRNSWRKGSQRRMGIPFVFLHLFILEIDILRRREIYFSSENLVATKF